MVMGFPSSAGSGVTGPQAAGIAFGPANETTTEILVLAAGGCDQQAGIAFQAGPAGASTATIENNKDNRKAGPAGANSHRARGHE